MDYALEPSRACLHGAYHRDLAPALVVEPGCRVVYRTLDIGWGYGQHPVGGGDRDKWGPRQSPRDDGAALHGPVYIQGAAPGDVVVVHVEEVRPAAFGWTWAGGAGFKNSALNTALGVVDVDDIILRWRLDPDAGTATSERGHVVTMRPFLGMIGLCPDEAGWCSPWPPRRVGGNMDCRELYAGAVLELPVEVPGALVSVGDGHAAQGDGEIAGTAIECPMDRVVLRYELRAGPLAGPRVRNPEGWATLGFGEDLDAAIAAALNGMLDLVQERLGLDRVTALAVASPVVDVRITQLVNGVRGAHAFLRHDAIRTS